MEKQNENSSYATEKNTKLEVKATELNSGLVGSSPPIPLDKLKELKEFKEFLDIKSIGRIILTLVLGVLGLVGMLLISFIILMNILLEHPFITSGIIFIVILLLVRTLPKDKIKALTEFIQSLPAQLFP